MQCSRNSQHLYPSHLKACPWCERSQKLGGNDPFPEKGNQKYSLPKSSPQKTIPLPAAASKKVTGPLVPAPPSSPVFVPRSPPTVRSPPKSSASGLHSEVDGKGLLAVLTLIAMLYWGYALWTPETSRSQIASSSPALSFSSSNIAMPTPARRWISTKVQGIWKGTFTGDPAVLNIKWRNDNIFSGTLTTQGSKGTYRIKIRGVMAEGGVIAFRETQVIRLPRRGQWRFGINVGTFSSNHLSISGRGKDPNSATYQWQFKRSS